MRVDASHVPHFVLLDEVSCQHLKLQVTMLIQVLK